MQISSDVDKVLMQKNFRFF